MKFALLLLAATHLRPPATLAIPIGNESQTIPCQATICVKPESTCTIARLLPDPTVQ